MKKEKKKVQTAKRRYQLELTRKPKYAREFGRVFVVAFIIMLLADYLFVRTAATNYTDTAVHEIESASNVLDYQLEKIFNDERYMDADYSKLVRIDGQTYADAADEEINQKTNHAMSAMNMRVNLPNYAFDGGNIYDDIFQQYQYLRMFIHNLYDDPQYYDIEIYNKAGVPVATNHPGLYIVLSKNVDEEKESTIYELNQAAIEKAYPGTMQELKNLFDMSNNGRRYVEAVFADEIYVKDGYVIPAKIEVTKFGKVNYNGETDDSREGQIIKAIDLSNCDLEGYEKVEVNDSDIRMIGPVVVGFEYSTNYHRERFAAISQEELLSNIKKTDEEGFDRFFDDDYGYTDFWARGSKYCQLDDSNLVAVITIDYDFFRDWKGIIWIICIFNLFLAVVIALIIGRIRFEKKYLAYEVDSYRRKTTNAMAHDLKTPLMAISGYAENLKNAKEPEKISHYVTNILDSISNMDQMIANILELAKLEDASLVLEKKEVKLEELLSQELLQFENAMKQKSMTIGVSGAASITADETLMMRLIDNLLSNAIKYGKEDSKIEIEISKQKLTVLNSFDGSLEQKAENLMEPFVKGNQARNNTEGNGLGLSIVKNIAEAHGYRVFIDTKTAGIFAVSIIF